MRIEKEIQTTTTKKIQGLQSVFFVPGSEGSSFEGKYNNSTNQMEKKKNNLAKFKAQKNIMTYYTTKSAQNGNYRKN